jgi:hypothetical protein
VPSGGEDNVEVAIAVHVTEADRGGGLARAFEGQGAIEGEGSLGWDGAAAEQERASALARRAGSLSLNDSVNYLTKELFQVRRYRRPYVGKQ